MPACQFWIALSEQAKPDLIEDMAFRSVCISPFRRRQRCSQSTKIAALLFELALFSALFATARQKLPMLLRQNGLP